MINKRIILIGAGGHCASVLDSLITSYDYNSIGIVDKEYTKESEKELLGVPIIGSDEDLPRLFESGYTEAFITVGSIGDTGIRRLLYNKVKEIGFHIPNILDKTCIVSHWCTLCEGIYVGKNAVINTNAKINNMAIINTSSTVEHDCNIGEFVHVSPGSVICGGVVINRDTHIGAGSVIRQGIHIGASSIIGLSSVVVRDIPNEVTAFGNPCRVTGKAREFYDKENINS